MHQAHTVVFGLFRRQIDPGPAFVHGVTFTFKMNAVYHIEHIFMQVVPETSSYPGYGEFVLLEGVDHINVCKPPQKTDVAYVQLMHFLKSRVQESKKSADHIKVCR